MPSRNLIYIALSEILKIGIIGNRNNGVSSIDTIPVWARDFILWTVVQVRS